MTFHFPNTECGINKDRIITHTVLRLFHQLEDMKADRRRTGLSILLVGL